VLFAGTLPLLDGGFVPGTRWNMALTCGDATLTCCYEAKRKAL
jgi:hypothetical protein